MAYTVAIFHCMSIAFVRLFGCCYIVGFGGGSVAEVSVVTKVSAVVTVWAVAKVYPVAEVSMVAEVSAIAQVYRRLASPPSRHAGAI